MTEKLQKNNKRVSLINIKKQVLEILNEVDDISVRDIHSYFFPKGAMDMAMFYNTLVVPLIRNNDIKLLNCNEDKRFSQGDDRILGGVILKLNNSIEIRKEDDK